MGFTVKEAVEIVPEISCEMVTIPGIIPVTIPVTESILATVVSLLLQTPTAVSESTVVPVVHTCNVPVICAWLFMAKPNMNKARNKEQIWQYVLKRYFMQMIFSKNNNLIRIC